MIYLIDPQDLGVRPPCIAKCKTLCTTVCPTNCGIKPLYGIDPVPM